MSASRTSVFAAQRAGNPLALSRRAILLATPLVFLAGTARAANGHWLLGTWDGERKNVATRNRTGTTRQLIVTSVNAAGTSAKAQWITGAGKVNVTLTIEGEIVRFATPGTQGNSYRLMRNGEALEGTWTSQGSGNSGAVALYKQ